jgi:hypothetical protein
MMNYTPLTAAVKRFFWIALWGGLSAGVTWLLGEIPSLDFGQLAPWLVPALTALLSAASKYLVVKLQQVTD